MERLAQVARETGKPQVLSSTLSWDPVEGGEPVTDYTMVSADGSVYFYTEREVI